MGMAGTNAWDVVLMRMEASVNSVEALHGNVEAPLGKRAQVLFFLALKKYFGLY